MILTIQPMLWSLTVPTENLRPPFAKSSFAPCFGTFLLPATFTFFLFMGLNVTSLAIHHHHQPMLSTAGQMLLSYFAIPSRPVSSLRPQVGGRPLFRYFPPLVFIVILFCPLTIGHMTRPVFYMQNNLDSIFYFCNVSDGSIWNSIGLFSALISSSYVAWLVFSECCSW